MLVLGTALRFGGSYACGDYFGRLGDRVGIGCAICVCRIAPQVGTAATEFTLPSQDGQVSLKDYSGKWVVLYFYPKDFTSGCTVEAHNFQRDQEQYAKKNAVVLGVSVDNVDSHKKFCTKEGLNFKL